MRQVIINLLDRLNLPLSTIEKDLGFGNGLLGKIKKEENRKLSIENFEKLKEFFKIKTGKEFIPSTIDGKVISGNASSFFDAGKINKRLDELSWVKEIEEYCNKQGILPQDLIDTHRNQNDFKLGKKQDKEVKVQDLTKLPNSNWRKEYIKNKTGITV